jgi:hypothetical protein
MARNIRRNFSGTLIGASASAKVGFFGAAPVTQPTSADQGALTHAVGTANGTVDDVGAAFNQATLNNNFKECTSRINALRDALVNLGLIKGS